MSSSTPTLLALSFDQLEAKQVEIEGKIVPLQQELQAVRDALKDKIRQLSEKYLGKEDKKTTEDKKTNGKGKGDRKAIKEVSFPYKGETYTYKGRPIKEITDMLKKDGMHLKGGKVVAIKGDKVVPK